MLFSGVVLGLVCLFVLCFGLFFGWGRVVCFGLVFVLLRRTVIIILIPNNAAHFKEYLKAFSPPHSLQNHHFEIPLPLKQAIRVLCT